MKITFEQSGGSWGNPLGISVRLDSNALPAADAKTLRELIGQAGCQDSCDLRSDAAQGAPDLRADDRRRGCHADRDPGRYDQLTDKLAP